MNIEANNIITFPRIYIANKFITSDCISVGYNEYYIGDFYNKDEMLIYFYSPLYRYKRKFYTSVNNLNDYKLYFNKSLEFINDIWDNCNFPSGNILQLLSNLENFLIDYKARINKLMAFQ